MESMPPQSPPVLRDPFADRPWAAEGAEHCAAAEASGGVQAAQSRCDHLRGPARSMCYASLYGVSV